MIPESNLTDILNVVQLLAPVANAFAGTVTSTYVNMASYKTVLFNVFWGVGATGTSTITVLEATSSAGAGATAVPFTYRIVANTASSDVPGALIAAAAAGFTTTAGSNQEYLIEVNAIDLDGGFNWVAVNLVEVAASARLGGIQAVMAGARNEGATMVTALT